MYHAQSLVAEDGKRHRVLGLRGFAQEFQDELSRFALINVAGVNGIKDDKNRAAGLAEIGQVAELVGLKLRRNGGLGVRSNKCRDRARLAGFHYAEIGLAQGHKWSVGCTGAGSADGSDYAVLRLSGSHSKAANQR